MAGNVSPPRPFDADPDADSWTPDDSADPCSTLFDKKAIAEQIETIVVQGNPHRHGQVPRSATELVSRQFLSGPSAPPFRLAVASPSHHVHSINGIQGANQHGSWRSDWFGDDVHQAVEAVVEIDVRVTRWTIERLVAAGRSRRGVAGWI